MELSNLSRASQINSLLETIEEKLNTLDVVVKNPHFAGSKMDIKWWIEVEDSEDGQYEDGEGTVVDYEDYMNLELMGVPREKILKAMVKLLIDRKKELIAEVKTL